MTEYYVVLFFRSLGNDRIMPSTARVLCTVGITNIVEIKPALLVLFGFIAVILQYHAETILRQLSHLMSL